MKGEQLVFFSAEMLDQIDTQVADAKDVPEKVWLNFIAVDIVGMHPFQVIDTLFKVYKSL